MLSNEKEMKGKKRAEGKRGCEKQEEGKKKRIVQRNKSSLLKKSGDFFFFIQISLEDTNKKVPFLYMFLCVLVPFYNLNQVTLVVKQLLLSRKCLYLSSIHQTFDFYRHVISRR